MSKVIDPVVATYYDSSVTVVYQGAVVVRPHVTVRTGIVGATAEFPRLNRGMARAHVPASPRIPVGLTYAKAVAVMQAWSAAEWSDDIEQTRINFQERPALAEALGYSIARRVDQIVVDQLVAALPTATIPDGNAGMTDAKLRQIARIFDERAVPRGNRKLLVSANVYDQIRGLDIARNRDFGETSTARTGVVPTVYGLDVLLMDNARDEGGLPIANGVRRCFAWDSRAVALAFGKEESLDINWVPERRAWLVERVFSAGATVIEPNGVLRVDCTE